MGYPLLNYVLSDEPNNGDVVGLLVYNTETLEAFVRPIDHETGISGTWIPFSEDCWPPSDDDLRRAHVIAAMHRR